MSRLFSDGYELNSPTDGVERTTNSGSVSIVNAATGPVRTGFFAGRANPSSATAFWRKLLSVSDLNAAGFARVYVRIASYPSVETRILGFQNAANSTVVTVNLTTTGTLKLMRAGTVQIGSATSALSLNAWYCIELKNDATTSPGSLEGRLDGSVFASGANTVQGSWAKVLWGAVVSCTADLYFDDFAVNDNSGTAQNTYPGMGGIIHLRPCAAGDSTTWTKLGSSVTNFSGLRETPPDDITSGVRSKVAGQIDDYNVDNSGLSVNDVINVVSVGVRYAGLASPGAPWCGFKVRIKPSAGGTVLESAEITPAGSTWASFASADPRIYPLTTYVMPGTSSQWTNADIDNAQIGLNLITATSSDALVTNLWLQVDYAAGAPVYRNTNNFLGFFE